MIHTGESNNIKALTIVEGLVTPNYPVNFQPTYDDTEALIGAVSELLSTTPATTPQQIDALRDDLAHLGLSSGHSRLDLVGTCGEAIRLDDPESDISRLTDGIIEEHSVVTGACSTALHAQRTAGQSVKPRSSETQLLGDGNRVLSFFGEGVNHQDADRRRPDPTRMVAMALQARDISETLSMQLGHHVPLAHEMLLLAYEQAFVRIDETTGKRYLLSADLPWIGVRTNNPDGPHVALLSTVENPIGVKIGEGSDARHIMRLARSLNPHNEPGKLVFMVRVGDNVEKITEILQAIKIQAPHARVLYDIHAVTRTNERGGKIRCVTDVIRQAKLVRHLCGRVGVTFDGHHLESTTEDRYECVDTPEETPTHPGKIDPRLNSKQLAHVLTTV